MDLGAGLGAHAVAFADVGYAVTAIDNCASGGLFVATFRDYCDPARHGVDRIIPVRQDDLRLLTCVLEYRDTAVTVHDLAHRSRMDAAGEPLLEAPARPRVGARGFERSGWPSAWRRAPAAWCAWWRRVQPERDFSSEHLYDFSKIDGRAGAPGR